MLRALKCHMLQAAAGRSWSQIRLALVAGGMLSRYHNNRFGAISLQVRSKLLSVRLLGLGLSRSLSGLSRHEVPLDLPKPPGFRCRSAQHWNVAGRLAEDALWAPCRHRKHDQSAEFLWTTCRVLFSLDQRERALDSKACVE